MGFFQMIMDLFVAKDLRFYNSGMRFMEKGDFLKATYDFKEAIKIKPTEEKYHDVLGKSMYKRGMVTEADHAFAVADDLKKIATEPRDVNVLCRLARAFQDRRMFSVSQDYIKRIMALDANNEQVHCLMGRAHTIVKKYPEAIKEFKKAIELNPFSVDAYKSLEDIYRIQGKKAKQREYEDIGKSIAKVRSSPSDANLHSELADVFRRYKRKEAAEEEYKEALKIDENCAGALVGMGISKFEAEQHAEAREQFLKAIKINKYNANAHSYLGLVYKADPKTQKKGEWELALAKELSTVEKATDPMRAYTAYMGLGDFLLSHKRVDDAEEAFLKGIKSNSNNPEAYIKIAILYADNKKADQALGYCDHAIKLAPKKEIGYLGKGRVFIKMKDYEKAISHLQEGLKFAPNNPAIHEFLAVAYKGKGLTKLAEKEMKIVDAIKTSGSEVDAV